MGHQQKTLIDDLKRVIASGEYPVGSYLPPAATLAKSRRCSTHAMQRAFRVLSDQGILHSVKRKGTRVVLTPPSGRVLCLLSDDAHTNILLQGPISQALIAAGLDVEFQPFLFADGPGYERLRLIAHKDAASRILLVLGQNGQPTYQPEDWPTFAADFAGRVCVQLESNPPLPGSTTIESDIAVAAQAVADHLRALGHRRIGVVAGGNPGDGSMVDLRAQALASCLAGTDVTVYPYYYYRHATGGVETFIRQHGCSAWWAVNDHQALEHLLLLQRAGLRVPEDVSIVGAHDTPWATQSALPLTSLSLDPPAFAAAVVDTVRDLLAASTDSHTATARRVSIPPVLVARGSTGPRSS